LFACLRSLDEVFPGTPHQRCWVHKTANVLNKVALSVQANMKKDLREIYLAPSRALAEVAIDVFAEKYQAKHHKAVDCLTKDREALLAFFDFPGLDVGPYAEVLGGLHHIAISIERPQWEAARARLTDAGVEVIEESGVSLYFRDPDGARLELLAEPLGQMYGERVV